MNESKLERAKARRSLDFRGENLKSSAEEDCPFCTLYVTEIGLKNGAYRDALYFAIHSNLESHKPDNILHDGRKKNGVGGKPVLAGFGVIPVS